MPKVRLATAEEINRLRDNAVATGFPESEVVDRRDGNPFVRHFLIEVTKKSQLLAGCSFKLGQHGGKPAWELYGVTIHSSFLAGLVGMAYEWPMIEEAHKILIAEHGVRMFWSIIQAKILRDYQSHGWEACGEELVGVGTKGPYQKIIRFIEE